MWRRERERLYVCGHELKHSILCDYCPKLSGRLWTSLMSHCILFVCSFIWIIINWSNRNLNYNWALGDFCLFTEAVMLHLFILHTSAFYLPFFYCNREAKCEGSFPIVVASSLFLSFFKNLLSFWCVNEGSSSLVLSSSAFLFDPLFFFSRVLRYIHTAV